MVNERLISIVIVCYNCEKTIKNCIESISNEQFNNIELILVDGKSKDETVSIIKSFEQTFNEKNIAYKWISEKDQGIYDAMNKGISLAEGRYLYFMGSDDQIIEGSLERIAAAISNLSNDQIIALPVLIHGKNGDRTVFPELSKDINIIHHQGALFKTKIVRNEKYLYENKYKIHSDFSFMTKYGKKFGVQFINIPLCKFAKGGTSTSGKNSLQSVKELTGIYVANGGNVITIKFFKLILRPLYYYVASIFSTWDR